MTNLVVLSGRITKEIDVKYTPAQMAVARFSLALDRGKDKDGNDKGADFPNCVAFGKTAEALERFSGKGLRVAVIGHLQTGSYEKNDGQKVYTTDVIVDKIEIIDWKEKAQETGRAAIEPNDFTAIDETIPFQWGGDMKTIQSKFDKETTYTLHTQYVSIQREGEAMRVPFRQIPNIIKGMHKEYQAELMEIYREKYPIVTCIICGKEFERTRQKQTMCSEECRRKKVSLDKKNKRELEKATKQKKCEICGKTFLATSNGSKYCSEECKNYGRYLSDLRKGKCKRKPKKDPLILPRKNQEARSQGLTYGQLQAQKYIAQMKGVLE